MENEEINNLKINFVKLEKDVGYIKGSLDEIKDTIKEMCQKFDNAISLKADKVEVFEASDRISSLEKVVASLGGIGLVIRMLVLPIIIGIVVAVVGGILMSSYNQNKTEEKIKKVVEETLQSQEFNITQ